MSYPLVAVLVGHVLPVEGVHAVGDHEGLHPLRAIASSLGHHSRHLQTQRTTSLPSPTDTTYNVTPVTYRHNVQHHSRHLQTQRTTSLPSPTDTTYNVTPVTYRHNVQRHSRHLQTQRTAPLQGNGRNRGFWTG